MYIIITCWSKLEKTDESNIPAVIVWYYIYIIETNGIFAENCTKKKLSECNLSTAATERCRMSIHPMMAVRLMVALYSDNVLQLTVLLAATPHCLRLLFQ